MTRRPDPDEHDLFVALGEHVAEQMIQRYETGNSIQPVSDRITTADVVKVAKLARLDLTPDEIERMTAQLDGMLEHFADIDALDLDDVAPMTQPLPAA